jgi:hypothetical protein
MLFQHANSFLLAAAIRSGAAGLVLKKRIHLGYQIRTRSRGAQVNAVLAAKRHTGGTRTIVFRLKKP